MYTLEFEVRDNEIDIQGVVNNSNYYIYFAHARHKYAKEIGLSFAQMSQEKKFVFLIKSEIEFKKPLKSEDKFYVTCKLIPEGSKRFVFLQEIKKLPDDVLIAKSYNLCVCIDGNNRNRPFIPTLIEKHFTYVEIEKSA